MVTDEWFGLLAAALLWPGEQPGAALQRTAQFGVLPDVKNLPYSNVFEQALLYAERGQELPLATARIIVKDPSFLEGADQKYGLTPVYADLLRDAVAEQRRKELQKALSTANSKQVAGLAMELLEPERAINETLEETVANFKERHSAEQTALRSGMVRPGFPVMGLDDLVPYQVPGQMFLLTAPTKRGKSSLALQYALYNAARGLRVLLFHFEDTSDTLMLRAAAQWQSRPSTEARPDYPYSMFLGKMEPGVQAHLYATLDNLNATIGQSFRAVYCGGREMEEVIRLWTALQRTYSPQVVVIDYLQKAALSHRRLADYGGEAAARGVDVELVKQYTERYKAVTLLVGQENDRGGSFMTSQAVHKSQGWIAIERVENDDHSIALDGKLIVRSVNNGRTGSIPVTFNPHYMVFM